MKKKILVADRDTSLKDIFRVTFTDEKYEILYAPTARDVERLAADEKPDVYVVNVSLQKGSGIEVYEKLQGAGLLGQARFFFLKNEDDVTDLLGYKAEGVIDKPINFYKLHERIDRDDDIIELTDIVEEAEDAVARRKAILEEELKKAVSRVETVQAPTVRQEPAEERRPARQTPAEEPTAVGSRAAQEAKGVTTMPDGAEKDWLESFGQKVGPKAQVTAGAGEAVLLRDELRRVLGQAMEANQRVLGQMIDENRRVLGRAMGEAVARLTDELATVITTYVEEQTRRSLFEVAERVIREEIDKLLKESSG
jgi:DNA-binding NarL/FixJ family response regulator